MKLETPIEKVPLIGPVYVKRLKRLEIKTVEDLIHHYPFRYEDFSLLSKISLLQPGEKATVRGRVLTIKNEYTKRGKKIQKAKIFDESGSVEVVWFNQPFLVKNIRPGDFISLAGKVTFFGKKIILQSPEYEVLKSVNGRVKEEPIHTGRLIPVYPETYGVSSKWLRSRIAPLLKSIEKDLTEFLPLKIIEENNLLDFKTALLQIHFPENQLTAQKARERLAFDELFLIQLASLKRKREWEKETVGKKLQITNYKEKIKEFIKNLPFELTKAQRKCVGEILTDMGTPHPMNRLLQGDVGSGKTVVATIAMYVCFLNGLQSALMAPTEILAFQHYETIRNMLEPLGLKIALKTGSKKTVTLSSLSEEGHQWNIIIGTHALLNEKLRFENLGLVVIDEQHRFGVTQRALLRRKGVNPHLLTMTATPIPRTVALTLYGELDLSFIDEMPKGRKPVKTWVVPPAKREAAYEWIKKHVKEKGEQAFIICPLIEESETLKAVKAATKEFERLKEKVFPKLNLGLIHGRMKAQDKKGVLGLLRKKKIDILVATPVVEVGIDIPDATIMMIEAAERFGLAQLHQLRGRVGRRAKKSYCLLFTESKSRKAIKRLKNLETLNIGAKLAELDLKLRGPGEIYGTKQHGIPNLKIASFSDSKLIEKARQAAKQIVLREELKNYPPLYQRIKRLTIQAVSPD